MAKYTAYHGSPNEFNEFDISKLGQSTDLYDDPNISSNLGFFFTDDKEYASGYGKYIYTCELDLDNILEVDMSEYMATDEVISRFISQAKSEGKDGVIFLNIREAGSKPMTQYVVFNPKNINIINKVELVMESMNEAKTVIAYHSGGWLSEDKNQQFFWFSSDSGVAASYTKNMKWTKSGLPILDDYETYELTIKKPYTIDAKENYYLEIPTPKAMKPEWSADTVDTDGIVEWAKKHGYGSVVIKNVVEGHGIERVATDYVLFNKADFKLVKNNANAKQDIIDELIKLTKEQGEFDELMKKSFGDEMYILKLPKSIEVGNYPVSKVEVYNDKLYLRDERDWDESQYMDKAEQFQQVLDGVKQALANNTAKNVYETLNEQLEAILY